MSQLLPDKFVPLRQSIIGQSAQVLELIQDLEKSIAALFIDARLRLPHLTYDSFVLNLDFLFAIGVIELDGTRVRRTEPDA